MRRGLYCACANAPLSLLVDLAKHALCSLSLFTKRALCSLSLFAKRALCSLSLFAKRDIHL